MKTGSTRSRLKFEWELGAVGIGLRYLTLDGTRAYKLGSNCQTCSFLFERLPGATKSVEIQDTADALRQGVNSLNESVVSTVGLGLPEEEYLVSLGETPVKLTSPGDREDYFSREQITLWGEDSFWCLPHDPRVAYYRGGEKDLGGKRRLFNFIVPMFPTKWLGFRAVSQYIAELSANGLGTAVSLSVLDVKGPADYEGDPDPSEHWCLTHFIVDGHHKLYVASEAGQPLRLLSFLALSQSASTREEVEQALAILHLR